MENINKSKEQLLEELERLQNRLTTLEKLELEHKRSQDALTLMASIVASSDDAIISKSLDGTILSWNNGAERIYGYSAAEAIGQPISILVPPNLPNEIPRILEKIARGERIEHFETVRKTKSGQLLNISLTISPLKDSSGQIVGASTIARDITERKQSEAILQKTQMQLLQSQKLESVGRLAGGVAHDFNNLLTAIAGYTDLILMDLNEDEMIYSDVREIQKATERAATLTRQLLAFSRQQVLQPGVINLNEVLTNMDKLLRRLIGEDIELVSIPSPDLGEAWADPGQIEQVIVNLAVNARDAMPDGGMLTIETANMDLDEGYRSGGHPDVKTGSYVMLAVTDTGIGMEPSIQEKIFEPFFTTKEMTKGTGLGLATVYGIVNQSEGYIWVYSEPGIGTTFKVYLPRIKSLPNTETKKPLSLPEHKLKTHLNNPEGRANHKIMVVEDETMVRELIYRVLVKAGYSIVIARNGQEALDLLMKDSSQVDLVMTDIIMPQMGGRELIDNIKKSWPTLKVVCMSGYTDRVAVRHGILDKCSIFLQKPFTPSVLLDKLDLAFSSEN